MKAYETKKKLALSLAVAMVASSAPVLAFADTAIVAQAEAEMTVEEIIASVSAAINDPFLAAGLARIEAGEAAVATLPDGATKTALTETLQTARHMYDGLEQINQIWVALGAAGWQTNYKTEVAELQAIIAQLDAAFPGGSAFLNNFKTAVTETGLTYAAFEAMDVADVNPTAANIAAAKEAVSKIMNPVAKANAQLRIETEIENQGLAVVSVSAINNKTLEVTFSKAVTKASAENVAYTVAKIAPYATNAVTGKTLSDDGKTLTLTLTNELVNAKGGYIWSVAKDLVKTVDGEKLAATEVTFDGVATEDSIKPAVQRAEYFAGNNTLTVKFNKPVSLADADVNEAKITVKGTGTEQTTTLTEIAYAGATGSADEITFKVPASVVSYTGPLTVEFGAEFVQDVLATPLTNDAQTVEAVTASKPAILNATYDEQTDKLVVTFNKTVDVETIDTANIKVKLNGASAIPVNGKVLTKTNGSVVEIETTFAEPVTVTASTIEITAGAVKDLAGNASIAQTGATLTYTDDKTAPTLVAASYNNLSDELTLTFSEKVKVDGTFLTSGVTVGGTAINTVLSPVASDTVVVRPGATKPSLTNKITIAKDAVQDMSGNKIAEVKDVVASVSDLTKPKYTVANATFTNKVTVTFDEKVNKATAEMISNYDVFAVANNEVKLNVKSALLGADGKTVTLTTDNQSGISYGLRVSNVSDIAGNVVDTPTLAAIQASSPGILQFIGNIGSLDTTSPKLVSSAIVDKDESGNLSKGDQLKLTFDEKLNVDFSKITAADFIVTNSGGTVKDSAEAFGSGTTFAYGDDSTEIVVTLGTLGVNRVVIGDNINVATNNDVFDLAGNKAAAAATSVIAPLDRPEFESIVYSDANGDGIVNAGDKVEFNFNQKVTIATLTSLYNMVENDAAFGSDIADITGGTSLTNVDSVEVTLTGTPTLVVGTTTDKGDATASTITNGWANPFAALTTAVKVTSEDTTDPTVVSAQVVKAGGNTGTALETGDKVVLTFNEPVNEATVKAGIRSMYIKTLSGIQLAFAGATADVNQTGTPKNEITITIAASDGWVGTEMDGLSFTTISKIFEDASGNKADLVNIPLSN